MGDICHLVLAENKGLAEEADGSKGSWSIYSAFNPYI